MNPLYTSQHYALTEIRSTDSKKRCGTLCFRGYPSMLGSENEVLALEDCIVLESGRVCQQSNRHYSWGVYVTVSGKNAVHITYARLSQRFVKEGEHLKAGQVIGLQGNTGRGSDEYLMLEFRRNNRRIDGCDYLGIPHELKIFEPPKLTISEIVAKTCRLDEDMCTHIDNAPQAAMIWQRLYEHLSVGMPMK